ncbi:SwmB domain-containing protein, partial [Verminephrobacter aporrectodeae]|uniref:SwmB domain-containing protein n=1 Tax=Verminephrobacter aporrectodeae TaxID=1110389 RepID=UPI002244C695
ATGNDAASFTDRAVSNLARDTTAPVLGSATVNGRLLVLTYTDATDLDAVRTAAASAFAVSSAGNEAISVSSVAVSDKTVTLTLSREVAGGETVKLSYTRPTTGDEVIQDAAGNDAASFMDQAVSNLIPDTTAPVLRGRNSVTVNGNRLELTYTDVTDLDVNKTAAASAFAVSSAGNAAISVDRVLVSYKTVILLLSREVVGGETLQLSYTRPATGENGIQDAAGNDAASFTDRAVRNLVRDTTAPVLGSATVNGLQLVLTYTDVTDLNEVNFVAASAFAVSSAGNEDISVSSVVVLGKTVTLTLSRYVHGGETVKLSYTKPATGDEGIRDRVGNDAASLTDQAVSNLVRDTMAPVLRNNATVRGDLLELTYADASDLDAVKTAAASAFAVSSAGNEAISVSGVFVSGKTVTLVLDRDVAGGETLKLSYTRPPTGDEVIQDAAGNDAASFTNQAVSNLVPDTTAPVLGSATVRGNQLVLTYTDAANLHTARTAAASAFAVSSAGYDAIRVDSVAVTGKTVTLTLNRRVGSSETVKLSYTKPTTGDEVIQDWAGNDAASFTDQAVSNLTPDTTAPVLDSATVNGRLLVLTYTDVGNLDTDARKIAAASAFAVSSVGNEAISVSNVSVMDKTVTLTLSRAVAGGETVKLSYTRPPTGDEVIQDAAGNDAASFTNQAVSNLVRDTTAPVLASATVSGRRLVLTYTDVGKLDTDAGKIVAASAFAVSSVDNAAISVSSVAVSDKTVTLTLSRSVAGGETVKLSYTRPTTGDNVIQDATGNDAASFMDQAVSNLVPDTTAPVLGSATVNGRLLVLSYTDVGNLDTDAGKIVAASAFAVSSVGNEAISVSSVAVSGKTVTLALSRSVAGGETLKLSYTRPTTGDNVIQDAVGNDAASFTDQAVSNLVPDITAPVLASATVNSRLLVLTYTDVGDLNVGKTAAASAFAVSSAG